MEYTGLEKEYDELLKDYDNLLIVNDKLQTKYDDLNSELNAMKSCVDHLVERKVSALLDKMGSFNNYYSEFSSVEECGDLLFCLSEDIEEYYNNMEMSIEEIVKTDVLELDTLLSFYSNTLSYNVKVWLKKIIIEEFIRNMSRNFRSLFIIQLDEDQRKTLRDILINEKIVVTKKFYFPIKKEHVFMILKLLCTNFSSQSLYMYNKQYFSKEIIESLDINKELKENILFQYKKDILKGDIKGDIK